MDVSEALHERLEIRNYSDKEVDDETKKTILEAGRNAPSGRNLQHWRFIVLDEQDDLTSLADVSPTGSWIQDADFAVVVLTDPQYSYHDLDAGRAITQMQLMAWNHGVGSCIYTGPEEQATKEFLNIPKKYAISAVVGFGYPIRDVEGQKSRKPLSDIAFHGRFGQPYGD